MSLEHCSECDQETGGSGRGEDSIYIEYKDQEIGPLCKECWLAHFGLQKTAEAADNE